MVNASCGEGVGQGSEADVSRGWQERLEKRIRNGYLNA